MDAAEILTACLETGGEESWTAFVRRFQPLIASSVIRVARSYGSTDPGLIDDLIQETYLRLCKDNYRSLREFKAKHDEAIFGFLKVTATNLARDHFRSRGTQKRRGEVEDDGTWGEPITTSGSMERAVLLEEFDRRLAVSESDRDRAIFWLYYRQGFTAKDIARMHADSLTESGVESCLHRLTRSLREHIHKIKEGTEARKPFGELR